MGLHLQEHKKHRKIVQMRKREEMRVDTKAVCCIKVRDNRGRNGVSGT